MSIRGTKNLDGDQEKPNLIVRSSTAVELKKFRKPAKAIKEIKYKWNKRVKKQQADGYSDKEIVNMKIESRKLEILEFLKKQRIPGPFTNPKEVKNFIDTEPEGKEKVERMRKEVHYAKLTCGTQRKFRLTKNGQSLTAE